MKPIVFFILIISYFFMNLSFAQTSDVEATQSKEFFIDFVPPVPITTVNLRSCDETKAILLICNEGISTDFKENETVRIVGATLAGLRETKPRLIEDIIKETTDSYEEGYKPLTPVDKLSTKFLNKYQFLPSIPYTVDEKNVSPKQCSNITFNNTAETTFFTCEETITITLAPNIGDPITHEINLSHR